MEIPTHFLFKKAPQKATTVGELIELLVQLPKEMKVESLDRENITLKIVKYKPVPFLELI